MTPPATSDVGSSSHTRPPGRDAPERSDAPEVDPRRLQVHREPPKRDCPYVPTDEPVVAALLRLANVREGDVLYDLGCGDGRIVIAAAKRGARAVGVDIDPLRIRECNENAKKAGVQDRVRFHCHSFFDVDLRDATVVALYLLPVLNAKLRPKLLWEMKPGTRVLCNHFNMGDWEADIKAHAHHRHLYEYIIPAWAGGTWRCVLNADPATGRRVRMSLNLHRRYQVVTGTARIGRKELQVLNGRLFGDQLTFKLPDPGHLLPASRFSARIEGDTLRGTCRSSPLDASTMVWGGTRAEGRRAREVHG